MHARSRQILEALNTTATVVNTNSIERFTLRSPRVPGLMWNFEVETDPTQALVSITECTDDSRGCGPCTLMSHHRLLANDGVALRRLVTWGLCGMVERD